MRASVRCFTCAGFSCRAPAAIINRLTHPGSVGYNLALQGRKAGCAVVEGAQVNVDSVVGVDVFDADSFGKGISIPQSVLSVEELQLRRTGEDVIFTDSFMHEQSPADGQTGEQSKGSNTFRCSNGTAMFEYHAWKEVFRKWRETVHSCFPQTTHSLPVITLPSDSLIFTPFAAFKILLFSNKLSLGRPLLTPLVGSSDPWYVYKPSTSDRTNAGRQQQQI